MLFYWRGVYSLGNISIIKTNFLKSQIKNNSINEKIVMKLAEG